jgi:hypothetical protein
MSSGFGLVKVMIELSGQNCPPDALAPIFVVEMEGNKVETGKIETQLKILPKKFKTQRH